MDPARSRHGLRQRRGQRRRQQHAQAGHVQEGREGLSWPHSAPADPQCRLPRPLHPALRRLPEHDLRAGADDHAGQQHVGANRRRHARASGPLGDAQERDLLEHPADQAAHFRAEASTLRVHAPQYLPRQPRHGDADHRGRRGRRCPRRRRGSARQLQRPGLQEHAADADGRARAGAAVRPLGRDGPDNAGNHRDAERPRDLHGHLRRRAAAPTRAPHRHQRDPLSPAAGSGRAGQGVHRAIPRRVNAGRPERLHHQRHQLHLPQRVADRSRRVHRRGRQRRRPGLRRFAYRQRLRLGLGRRQRPQAEQQHRGGDVAPRRRPRRRYRHLQRRPALADRAGRQWPVAGPPRRNARQRPARKLGQEPRERRHARRGELPAAAAGAGHRHQRDSLQPGR